MNRNDYSPVGDSFPGVKLMQFARRLQCKIRIGSLLVGMAATSLPITLPHLAAQRPAAQPTQEVQAPGSNSELASGRNTLMTGPADEGPAPGKWGDQGDGTYMNPVMPGDFSDLDAIRVGSDYYAISSTMQYSPGVVILHSRDLVNWTILGHVVHDVTALDPELAWDRMGRQGRGVWAGALRLHDGRFWVYFGTPDQGIFVSTAVDPAGAWSRPKLVLDASGWDDPCPFWDDDGQGYLVATHFASEGPSGTKYNIHLFQLNAEGDGLAAGFDQIIHQSRGSEANKLYKINGYYYHYYSEVKSEGRVPMMERSRNLEGPWEIHQLMHVHPAVDKEPNQGGLVELPSEKWYFVTHQGHGDWEGRAGVLLPVSWIDGWPIPGEVGSDGIGNMVWRGRKPIRGFPETSLQQSDSFDEDQLKSAWEWRYQPRPNGWSLSERRGYLRLHASPYLRPDDFNAIPDVLTQRSLRTPRNEVTVRMDISAMVNGQEAGLAHFAKTYGTLSVIQTAGIRRLSYNFNGARTVGPEIKGNDLYLRSTWDAEGESRFSYSVDGRNYQEFGDPYTLTWGSYRGDRIGLFTVASAQQSGYIDVDWFRYSVQR